MAIIHINADIGNEPGEIGSKDIKRQLPTNGEPITAIIHSEGGSVFEAFAIIDALDAYPGRKTAVVSSMAFSAASLILCAFDSVEITQNGYVMVHAAHIDRDDLSPGEQSLLVSLRSRMIGIYAKKTGQPVSVISRLIDQETFFDAEASVSLGLVDRIANRASFAVAKLPAKVLAKLSSQTGLTAKARWEAAVDASKASGKTRAQAVNEVDKTHPGLRLKFIAEYNAKYNKR